MLRHIEPIISFTELDVPLWFLIPYMVFVLFLQDLLVKKVSRESYQKGFQDGTDYMLNEQLKIVKNRIKRLVSPYQNGN